MLQNITLPESGWDTEVRQRPQRAPVPLRLFQHHHSAGFKPLSVSPFCIPTARRCGGDSTTPPACCPATSIQTLSLNPQWTSSCQTRVLTEAPAKRAVTQNAAAPLISDLAEKTLSRRREDKDFPFSYQEEYSET